MVGAPYPLDPHTQSIVDETKKLDDMLADYENKKKAGASADELTAALNDAFGQFGFGGASAEEPPPPSEAEMSPDPFKDETEHGKLYEDGAEREAAGDGDDDEDRPREMDAELQKACDEAFAAQARLEATFKAGGGGAEADPEAELGDASDVVSEADSFARAAKPVARAPGPAAAAEPEVDGEAQQVLRRPPH